VAAFPSDLKPSLTQGYGFGQSNNVITDQVAGGAPTQTRDFRTGTVPFSIGMVLDPVRMKTFQSFYFSVINSGADKFTMILDSGNGLEEHVVMITPGSVSFNGDRAPIWSVSFAILAETTPFQENQFGGNLSDLYDEYGDDVSALLNQLAILALEDLPYGT